MRPCRAGLPSWSVALAAGLGALCTATSASAQVPYEDPPLLISGDMTLASQYNWRGLTRVNGWVLQPDLYVVASLGSISRSGGELIALSISAGVWGNIELSSAGADENADRGAFGFGEVNPWIQVGAAFDDFDFALGATRYLFQGDAANFLTARTSAQNATELYLDARRTGRRFEPRVTWWLDVGDTRGSYFETALTTHIPFLPFFPSTEPVLTVLDLDVALGWSAGQAHFDQDGLTHVTFSLSSPFILAGFSFEPSFNLQLNRDVETRRVRPGENSGSTVWWSLAVGPLRALGFGGGP